jgi:hypothetical protein
MISKLKPVCKAARVSFLVDGKLGAHHIGQTMFIFLFQLPRNLLFN